MIRRQSGREIIKLPKIKKTLSEYKDILLYYELVLSLGEIKVQTGMPKLTVLDIIIRFKRNHSTIKYQLYYKWSKIKNLSNF